MDAFAGDRLDIGCGSNLGMLIVCACVCVCVCVCVSEVGRQLGEEKPTLGGVGIYVCGTETLGDTLTSVNISVRLFE